MDISLGAYLREQRHIFGICPCCRNLSRLPEIKISYRTKYIQDWLDKITAETDRWEEKIEEFEDEAEVGETFRERTRQTLLQTKLKKISPVFARNRLSPADVRVVAHPVDFVGFDGIASGELKRILLLDKRTDDSVRTSMQASIRKTVQNQQYDLTVLRIDEQFNVSKD